MKRLLIFLALAVFLTAGVALAGGGYEILWFSVDSGGGESAGGGFTLAGAIGQADAGGLSGGEYTLTGGFWAGTESAYFRYLPVIMRQ